MMSSAAPPTATPMMMGVMSVELPPPPDPLGSTMAAVGAEEGAPVWTTIRT
jgi:hypothetical protein